VNKVRATVMLLAAVVAIWKGSSFHTGRVALLAYGLAAAALTLAAWHFTRKPPRPRV
jgi:hypothetical protein